MRLNRRGRGILLSVYIPDLPIRWNTGLAKSTAEINAFLHVRSFRSDNPHRYATCDAFPSCPPHKHNRVVTIVLFSRLISEECPRQ